ncbi:hypothetical protein ABZ840_20865 [Streptomyces sp. NPDC047117]|uniref:hypothetical protein n=1 Tax=Streptomyces sp. NPDC047117 TaxID=3155379 RepID=UPI0033C1DF48
MTGAPADVPAADFRLLEETARTWHPADTGATDPLDPAPVAALSAVLDLPEPVAAAGQPLPPLWHWLHFLTWPRQSELGPDGHLRDGHFLPPLPERRRMFAGGRLEVRKPLTVGQPAEQTSGVVKAQAKQGRTGGLLFVTARTEFRQDGEVRVTEEQDIVYRSGGGAPVPDRITLDPDAAPHSDAPWQLPWTTDPAVLFRVSALTANAHRIHYDQPYVTGVEGYPGLVVHGPLLVLQMLELVRRHAPGRTVRTLSYRLRQPSFCGERLLSCGTPYEEDGRPGVRLSVAGPRAAEHATAEVTFA